MLLTFGNFNIFKLVSPVTLKLPSIVAVVADNLIDIVPSQLTISAVVIPVHGLNGVTGVLLIMNVLFTFILPCEKLSI